MEAGGMEEGVKKERLWTKNFTILWQGQLVSTLGDTAYAIALGFWVLAVTGSTALMGTLMAASTLPGVITSIFAGVWVDTLNKKRLLIMSDMIRGIAVVAVAIAAYLGVLEVWMVFIVGVILSVFGALFRPGINSAIPEIVPMKKIPAAISMFSMVGTGANMAGNLAGGFLFAVLGAPAMFLFNGLSYIFSGGSILFTKIPSVKRKEGNTFFRDFVAGCRFVWRIRGLRYAIIVAALINFFFSTAVVLLLPLFQRTPGLGPEMYGIAMACFMGGAMIGFLLSSLLKTAANKKFFVFMLSDVIFSVCLVLFANIGVFAIMCVAAIIGGAFNAIVNVLLQSAVQTATPQDMRGKVQSFMTMMTQGLTPFAMALGGVLGGIFQLQAIMSVCFSVLLILVVPFAFSGAFKRFINFDFNTQTIEDVR